MGIDGVRTAIEELLKDDSDLVGTSELERLALARELLNLDLPAATHPTTAAFLQTVCQDISERTAPLGGPCPASAGSVHRWQLWRSGYVTAWAELDVQLESAEDDPFDSLSAIVRGAEMVSDTGTGLTLLRCCAPGCSAERYVPFDCDLGWDG